MRELKGKSLIEIPNKYIAFDIETAGIIANKLGLDVDKAITLGYIHDIGKRSFILKCFMHFVM